MTENENVERIRQQEQPKKADEIKRAMNIGFHLKCLRCGKTYYHTEFAMSEMSYRMYSYCPDCIDKGIEALKGQEPVKPRMDFDGQDVWRCGNCGRTLFHPTHTECDQDAKNIVRFCSRCGKEVDWDGL